MKIIVPISPVKNAQVTYSSIAEPDTTIGETAWSATEQVVASSERIIATPSATVTLTIASPCVVTYTDNGLAVDTQVVFTNSGGALPTGITSGATYYLAARLSVNTFTIKDADGRTINTTGSQSGTHTCTANVHKVYVAAVGSSATVTADAGTDEFTLAAHGFTGGQALVFTSTGAVPAPLVAGTLYTPSAINTNTFRVQPYGGGANINLTDAGSGTITVGYVSASVPPNYGKHPAIEATHWTLVGATNKWATFDGAAGTQSEAASPYKVRIVPGEAWDSVAILNHNATGIAARFDINQTTVTFTAATDKVNWTGHGLAADTQVAFTNSGGALPTEVVTDTIYYVKSPGANDFLLSATAGGATIDITGAGTGTHTGGQVVYSGTLDATQPVPVATGIVSEANQGVAAYQNGTLTVTLTNAGTVSCGEVMIGLATEIGATVNDLSNGIRNYSLITRDDFGNVTITQRGYTQKLRANVLIEADIDDVSDFLATHKDDTLLILATDGLSRHCIHGIITDWEMSSDATHYAVLRLEAEGLLVT